MEGGSNVDGDESGGTSPSRQSADTGILVPRNLLAMAAEIGIAYEEKGSGIRVSSTGVKIGPKAGTRGGPSCPGGCGRGLLMTHKCRGSIVVFLISKSVEPNKEQKVLTSDFG